MRQEIYLTIVLLSHYGILQAKLIDIHLSNPAEEATIEREKQRLQNDKDLETINDEKSKPKDIAEAWERLLENGGMS